MGLVVMGLVSLPGGWPRGSLRAAMVCAYLKSKIHTMVLLSLEKACLM